MERVNVLHDQKKQTAPSTAGQQSLVNEENILLVAAKEAADRGRLPEFAQNLRTGLRRTTVAEIGLRLVVKGFVEAEIKARFAKAEVFLRILRLTTAGFDRANLF